MIGPPEECKNMIICSEMDIGYIQTEVGLRKNMAPTNLGVKL